MHTSRIRQVIIFLISQSAFSLIYNTFTEQGAWEETEERLKEIFVDDFSKLDVRRDVASETLVISRPPPGQKKPQKGDGVRALHLPKRNEDELEGEEEETVLAFEQAVLAALSAESESESSDRRIGQLGGGGGRPIDAVFWADLDGVFETVYSQTFEALVQSVGVPPAGTSSVAG